MSLRFVAYRRRQWVLRYRDPWSGRPRVRSFASEEEAKRFEAVQGEMYAREKELIRRARRRTSGISGSLTVAELLTHYLETLSNPVTRKMTGYHLASFFDIFGKRRAARLSSDDVLSWMDVQRLRGVGASTIYHRASVVRTAYNWAVRTRHLSASPLVALQLRQPRKRSLTPPTIREAKLMAEAAAPHVRRVIVVGAATGARIGPSELFRLRWSDVDLENGLIRMPNADKGAHLDSRRVPISESIARMLKEWKDADSASGIAHVIHHHGRPVKSIAKGWHAARKRAGVTRPVTPYSLRHAFATEALAHAADPQSVAQVMGHKDLKMILLRYQHAKEEQRRAAVNAAPWDFAQTG